jgi:hypothetical protein
LAEDSTGVAFDDSRANNRAPDFQHRVIILLCWRDQCGLDGDDVREGRTQRVRGKE